MVKVAAVILAAGSSTRHAAGDKLLRAFKGAPLVSHAFKAVSGAGFDDIVAVVRNADREAARVARAHGIRVIVSARAAEGMGHSLAAGVAAVAGKFDGAAIFLGDMPNIKAGTIIGLLRIFAGGGPSVVFPVYNGLRGHPAFFARKHFAALQRLEGDKGAAALIANSLDARAIAVDDPGVLVDFDRDVDFSLHG